MADEEKSFYKKAKEYIKKKAEALASRFGGGKKGGGEGGEPEVQAEGGGRFKFRMPGGGAKTAIGLIIVVIFGLFAAMYITGYGPVRTLIEIGADNFRPVLQQQINGVPLIDSPKYLSCVVQNSFVGRLGDFLVNAANFQTIGQSSAGIDVWEYCKQDLIAAQDIGCTDCFDISAETLTFRVQAGTGAEGIVTATISAAEEEYCYNDLFGEQSCQAIEPAEIDSVSGIRITSQDNVDAKIESNINIGNELNPAILRSTPITIVGSFDTNSLCGKQVNTIDPDAILTYKYTTRGQAPINIRKQFIEDSFTTVNNPITLPGPIKLDIVPDSSATGWIYTSGIYKNAIVFLKFRNAGRGHALVNSVELRQIPPENQNPLTLTRCTGDIDPTSIQSDGQGGVVMTIKGEGIELNPSDRSNTITCIYQIPDSGTLPSDLSTYIIVGKADYQYQLKSKASSIIVEDKCTGNEVTTTTSGPTSTTTVSGEQCVLANENKECAIGTFSEDGCCR